ncbi:MAG: DNA topoisomerase I [Candidatus Staskawiczbacteria bacterium RIFCSPLOWO2_01_FULL_37_25b]|uniref:DNA topoisomerase 1 n=2 Tax=Candidatus Staskawicziibacteriota TaxID=1817916 RepID=A0A1G2HR07_9BACT|nr:MAG: DNA topoisomerase I [Candidatus Staskawiczbacteria bacterium RIFCSPHIGHO2_01_FULL_36_16]OGZ72640.1 MAG: DNA topoisomerase I [Candidatus Staskawiczbacteria bacterium RIFCSPLOWO2_01_FULL_37_25b]
MQLVIVESPTKSKTISRFLGKDYKVLASFGHIRDLPKKELGVDIDNNFEPKYVIPPKAKKTISELKKESEKAENTILATDEDREGESIAWHLAQALGLGKFQIPNSKSQIPIESRISSTAVGTNPKSKIQNPKPYQRIVFHEITKEAIQKALENPREIDMNLVSAQQARRILDRIVGYKLSPFLWKKISKGLSAGRVQSVAVRLVVEREREIEKFVPQEYWSVEALLKKLDKEFLASLAKKDGKSIDKLEVKNKTEADKILADLNNSEYIVENVEKKETKRYPAPPFTTSTLQQASWQRFKFSAKMTMSLAQRLYEEGHITYHRTDSLNLAETSLSAAKKFITEKFGNNYWAGKIVKYKTKSNSAQEAHEAIRPAYADRTPESLNGTDSRQLKLYTLIWQRFIACQMAPAVFDSVSADIKAGDYTFRANGQTLKFDGFLKIYPSKFEEKDLPDLEKNDKLNLLKLDSAQHFTEPPARYTEASLIKILEKYGIGRPSTYAPTIATIQTRNYVEKNEQKRFIPTEIGAIVNNVLVQNFPEIVDIDFTAKMEKELDEVAEGKDSWQKTCEDFWKPFSKNLEEKYIKVQKADLIQETDKICPKCGSPIIERFGKFGKFYACSKFPECKYTESIEGKNNNLGIKCPKCKDGDIVVRKTKRGKIFYGCNKFPKCDFALWDKPKNEFCPKCDSILIEKGKKIICSNKDCDYTK